MKRVLVIAYYFPPMGLSGVQRVAGFVRHLPSYGWEPTVLTVEPAGYFAYDDSLLQDLEGGGFRVVRTRSIDPTRLFRRRSVVSMPKEATRQRLAGLSDWMFVPDNKLGWMPFALVQGTRLMKEQRFDAIFSSAPPYTCHLIASRLSRRMRVPLVVDFRDDWVGNPRHQYPTPLHKAVHARMEGRVLRQSRGVVTINDPIQAALEQRNRGVPVKVITHGYDATGLEATTRRSDGKLQLLYTGVFYDVQTPDYFLRGLRGFLDACPETEGKVEAVFAGLVPDTFQQLVTDLRLSQVVRHLGYLPHDQVRTLQQQADVLWMTVGTRPGAEGISTGKLFEYIGRRKPILALVPEGTAKDTLKRYGAAYFAPPEDADAIQTAIGDIHAHWSKETLPFPDEPFAASLERRVLTRALSQLLDSSQPAGSNPQ